jgi:ACS family hexuronate transporter-like MFS transporter
MTGGTATATLKATTGGRTPAQPVPWRWIAIAIFLLSSSTNYLDRQLLAAVAPALQSEFHFSNAQYGLLVSAFSLTYMLMAPVAGLFVDRLGLNLGVIAATASWSVIGSATGLVQGFRALFTCRMALGMAEAAGIPAASKATATYLEPREFSLGNALQAVGITLGSIAAPLLVAFIVPIYGWRGAFVFCGGIGFFWVPVWWATSRVIPALDKTAPKSAIRISAILRDLRFWLILLTNVFVMTLYSLWTNWTTIYFVRERHLTPFEANRYFAWIPPIFATLGGFLGGSLAWRWIGRNANPVPARIRVCTLAAPLLLVTATIPFLPSNGLALAAISASFLLCMTFLINLHVIPIDLFGPERAAFTSAVLTSSYALMQAVISPVIGATVDKFGFTLVCVVASVLPLAGLIVLRFLLRSEANPENLEL